MKTTFTKPDCPGTFTFELSEEEAVQLAASIGWLSWPGEVLQSLWGEINKNVTDLQGRSDYKAREVEIKTANQRLY